MGMRIGGNGNGNNSTAMGTNNNHSRTPLVMMETTAFSGGMHHFSMAKAADSRNDWPAIALRQSCLVLVNHLGM